jgi:hypothetical protein
MDLVDGTAEPTAIVGGTTGGPAVRAVGVIRENHGVAGTDITGVADTTEGTDIWRDAPVGG